MNPSLDKRKWVVQAAVIVTLIALLAGCGPTPEEAATQAASAWTDTPAPTETATLTAMPSPTLTPTLTPTVSLTGRIVFVSRRDGNDEIYVMNADGSGQTNLTNNPAGDYYPDWSPDGRRIAFASDRDGNSHIYVMNADPETPVPGVPGAGGSDVTLLTGGLPYAAWPIWSPDGRQIAFVSGQPGEYSNVYVMDSDGSGIQQVSTYAEEYRMAIPAWSPDGQWIAYFSEPHDSTATDINLIRPDGTGLTTIRHGQGDDFLAWSPDGRHISLESQEDIFVMNADGTDQTNLTGNLAANFMAVWSPDGRYLAFSSNRDEPTHRRCPTCNYDIYRMDADPGAGASGSNLIRLTTNPLQDYAPAWSPDGQWIAYMCARGDDDSFRFNICLTNADGTTQITLSDPDSEDFYPRWQPAP